MVESSPRTFELILSRMASRTLKEQQEALQKEIAEQDEQIKHLLRELGVELGSGAEPPWIWTCGNPDCNELNVEGETKLTACEVCGAERPVRATEESKTENQPADVQSQPLFSLRSTISPGVPSNSNWTCGACMTLNEAPNVECKVCFADRNQTSNSATSNGLSSISWDCAACSTTNTADSSQCKVCFFDKEDSIAASAESRKCQACMTAFPKSSLMCPVCFTEAEETNQSGWKCKACLSQNAEAVLECTVCYSDRPMVNLQSSAASTTVAPSAAASGWICTACTSVNESNQRECAICYADKEETLEQTDPSVLDLSGGKRELLDGKRASQLLSVVQDPNAVRKLIFKTKSFGTEASLVAAAVLKTLKNVEFVDFSDIIAGRPTDEALNVLKTMCEALPLTNIKVLNLSDNAIGERGMRVLSDALKAVSNTIEVLSFRNNGLSSKSIELFVQAMGNAPKLQGLHFFSNMCGDDGAKALAPLFRKLGDVRDLPFDFTLSSCRVLTEGIASIAESLKSVTHRLRSLDLNDSVMSEAGGKAIGETLSMCTKLETLSLRDPGLDVAAAKASVIAALPKLTHLISLDLCEASLGKKSVNELLQALKTFKDLRVLRLAGNRAGTAGVKELMDSNALTSLETIDLRENELDDDFAVPFIEAWAARHNIKSVELGGNDFSASTLQALEKAFGAKLTLRDLGDD